MSRLTPDKLWPSSEMSSFSSSVAKDDTEYVWADGTPVKMEGGGADGTAITPGNVGELGPGSLAGFRALYKSLLRSSEKLAYQELSPGVQARIFAVADRLEVSGDNIDIYVNDNTPPAPYNLSLAKALSVAESPKTANELRAKKYDGRAVLLSGGVNNFVVVEEKGHYAVKLLVLTRNVISNDKKTALADAGKAQSPGGGRLENAAVFPRLAIDETAEEVRVEPALNLGRALIAIPELNSTRMRVFVGDNPEPVAQFFASPFIDEEHNTLEGYANAIHFPSKMPVAQDQHTPDKAELSNGHYIYRANEVELVDFSTLRQLAQKALPELAPNEHGIIDASILDYLELGTDYRVDESGDYALQQPTGLTPQLTNMVENKELMRWFGDFEEFINTPTGKQWVGREIARYVLAT